MSSVFNSPFEISLRILLALEVADDQWQTADILAVADFITVYSKDFGISDKNLHGENNYKFSEFALRRELVHKSIKLLVLDDLINISSTEKGFSFSINPKGLEYCSKFENAYADAYRDLAKQVRSFISDKSERETLELINRRSITSLQRREIDD